MQIDTKTREAIEDIINRREGMASMQSQIKEDIKAVGEVLGVKTAQIGKIIALVEKERAKGDAIAGERDIIEAAADLAGTSEGEE
ncbi:hypothetical protein F6A13_03650 [Acidithiobacillus sp. 'AMD consortium']|uniref:hypothetical protein n=1 Tax=Acidithiobacillus sp. 'AMD consortium' TaxID=2614801 RepID=UPI00124C64B5|nr:hypothetical protein [Acidithiobacillus sp. 'AMD consortium']QFG77830.1 hypothetical protein F6A13_03650 [Acidithiobacillus sp. 'AMD consortium']